MLHYARARHNLGLHKKAPRTGLKVTAPLVEDLQAFWSTAAARRQRPCATQLLSSRNLPHTMVKAPLAPPGSALLVDLTGHKSTFAASELWAKSSAVIFVARRPG